MKSIFAIALSLLATAAFAADKTEAKLDYDAAYAYSLTVTDESGEEYFTLTLMKGGELSYEYWVDSQPNSSQEVKLSPDQFKSLSDKFSAAFGAMAKTSGKTGGADYALEKIDGRKATTYTVTGNSSAVKPVLEAADPLISGQYPIAIK